MMKTPTKFIALLSGAALLASSGFAADSVATNPVGYTTWTITAGTGTARAFTTLALPLYQPTSSTDGAATGVIASVSANTLTVTGAAWAVGELSDASAPFCLRITSGLAEGRNLLVSTSVDNTADTLTVDLSQSGVSDLTAIGVVAATDTFELVECDTLGSLFPAPVAGGVVGASVIEDADQLWLFVSGTLEKFYYDTDLGHWTKEVSRGAQPDLSFQTILPDAGILYSRKDNSSSDFVISGTVPGTDRQVTVSAAGLTLLGSSWPTDVTLADTNIESIDGWVDGTSSSSFGADTVFLFNGGTRDEYYHDGVNWRLVSSRNPAISDGVVVGAGSAIVISKTIPYTSDVVLTQFVPYNL